MPVQSGSWPRFWPPACPKYTNCTPRPPLSEREEEPRDVGLAPQPQRKMGTDERMESAQKLHIRLKCCLCRKDNLDRKKVNYHLQLTWLSKQKETTR